MTDMECTKCCRCDCPRDRARERDQPRATEPQGASPVDSEPERSVFTAHRGYSRDFTSNFAEFQLDAPETPRGGVSDFIQKMSNHKRPMILGVVVLAVLVGAFVWLTPHPESSSAMVEVNPAATSDSELAWTPTPASSAVTNTSHSVVDPDEVVDYVRKALDTTTDDRQVATLWTRLGVEKGSPVAIAQTARTGDFALVTVAAIRSTGEISKVQCEIQRDASGWHIREIQAAS